MALALMFEPIRIGGMTVRNRIAAPLDLAGAERHGLSDRAHRLCGE
ncbi:MULTISPECIES: hypothetical protein [Sphingobium]|nr:hypothetical protein [Sphingobium sp. 15-1]